MTCYCLASLPPPFLLLSLWASSPSLLLVCLSPPLLGRTNSWLATRLSIFTQYAFSFLPGRENRSLQACQWSMFKTARGWGKNRLRLLLLCRPTPSTHTPSPLTSPPFWGEAIKTTYTSLYAVTKYGHPEHINLGVYTHIASISS